jgi:hypothetical protein
VVRPVLTWGRGGTLENLSDRLGMNSKQG